MHTLYTDVYMISYDMDRGLFQRIGPELQPRQRVRKPGRQ
jgi:hypothetical protein